MLIQVLYGYKQSQIFNINCQVAPLLDCIKQQAVADILQLLQAKELAFASELVELASCTEKAQKELFKLENPPPDEEKKPEKPARKKQPVESKLPTPEPVVERKETARKKEERKGKKVIVQEEVKELTPEETKQQKLESLKEELRNQLEQFSSKQEKINEKLEMLRICKRQYSAVVPEIDLQDPVGNRKMLRTRADEAASSVLNSKTSYQLMWVGDNEASPFEVDGFCVRTIEEDQTAQEDPDPKSKIKKIPTKKK